ncbi:MAG TPA: FemAB family XrtA/PEP-CTERM system-associated protein [Allosphingosinicella sp.]|nr:FemAB family XrtA/PEP-CTERM system-associated protein [Allosphingosinicella sp.]
MNALTPLLTVHAADLAADTPRIDAFVRAHPGAEPFHRPQWITAVERGCRQRAHYLIAEEAGGALVGALPLTEMRSFLFGNAMVSAGFATGGGILASTEAGAAALADAAWRLARGRGCASVELRGGGVPAGWQRNEGVYAAFSTPAVEDEAALLATIPRRQRAEIRKAFGFGLDVSTGRDAAHVEAFRRVYGESVRNLGTPVFPAGLFRAMAEGFGEDCDVLLIRKDGRPLAAFFNFYLGDTAFSYWGGGTAEARRWRANDLVYFEFIRHAARRGCRTADFGRSKLGTGACERKRIWGFEERALVYAQRTAEGAASREINPLDPKYQARIALWRRLPLPLANALGPLIARGLG